MEPTDSALESLRACCENIDGKWKGAIIFHLMGGTKRFSELKRLLEGVTQRVLTLELRQLEESGIVQRRVYAQVPPRVEYSLSELGRTLEPIIQIKQTWGKEYLRQRALQRLS
jgi:DNA-binding HxlR family transcriptional regulator